MHTKRACTAIFVLALAGAQASWAQADYPNRPIRLVVSSAAGGTGDTLARMISRYAAADLGTNIVIDNRPGATGMIATDTVVKADPAGYTLLQTSSSLITSAATGRKLPYDVMKDLAPVTNLGTAEGYLVLVNANVPAKSIAELMSLAKTSRLLYGSPGTGNPIHFMTASMNLRGGVEMTHVPYKSLAPAINAVLSGEIQVLLAPPLATRAHIASGKLRALASVSSERITSMPDLPTMQDVGFKGFTLLGGWQGWFAPADTPAAVVEKLHRAAARAVATDEVRTFMRKGGYVPDGRSSAAFRRMLEEDLEAFRDLARKAGIREK